MCEFISGEFSKKYKFYLAFENSNCNEYITEKFWRYLSYGLVPVAFGAPFHDYRYLEFTYSII